MRHAWSSVVTVIAIATVVAIVVLAVGATSSEAQFSRRYCTFGGSDNSSGEPDCSYNTWEQCRASASGLARYCGENPEYLRRSGGYGQEEPVEGRKGKSKSKPKRNN